MNMKIISDNLAFILIRTEIILILYRYIALFLIDIDWSVWYKGEKIPWKFQIKFCTVI
jgi:hypothetical protein